VIAERHRPRSGFLGLALALATQAVAVPAFALPAVVASEQSVPKNDGWVTDLAGLLTPEQEQQLEARMESYRRGSGHDIALLTVPSLNGEPIERYALRVAREWKLGSAEGKDKNDGALLVVAKADRTMRIEVGRGLEGTLPDIICGRIIRDVITPAFQRGDFSGGLRDGVEALQRAAGGDYAPLPEPKPHHGSGGAGFIPILFVLLLVFGFLRRRFRGGGGGGTGGSIWPWLILANTLSSSRGRRGGGFGGFGGGFGGGGFGGGSSGGGGFGGFGGGGGFSGGGASGRW
jgi:uncharacterized protein